MTVDDFKKQIKSKFKVDDTSNYVTCYVFIGMGLFFIYQIWTDNSPAFILIVALLPMFMGFYGLWRIDKSYVVVQLNSNKTVSEKEQVINNYLQRLNVIRKNLDENILSVRYRNKFFAEIDVRFYWDDKKILFNAEGADSSGLKGIIDFGIGKRSMQRIKRYLEDCL